MDVRQAVAGGDRYIIKPHGTVDSISQMMFTLDDYARARVEYYSFYELLTELLHTHTFFCIGCGLSDPVIKLIFEDYRYKYNETPHFITLPNPVSPAEGALMQKTRGLSVINYSTKDNHRELTLGLQGLSKLVASKRAEIAISQNW
jgi:SIR2-like protein